MNMYIHYEHHSSHNGGCGLILQIAHAISPRTYSQPLVQALLPQISQIRDVFGSPLGFREPFSHKKSTETRSPLLIASLIERTGY
jgi:hypothetical protein